MQGRGVATAACSMALGPALRIFRPTTKESLLHVLCLSLGMQLRRRRAVFGCRHPVGLPGHWTSRKRRQEAPSGARLSPSAQERERERPSFPYNYLSVGGLVAQLRRFF